MSGHASQGATAGVALPALPLAGGCQCGQLRYRLHEAPLTLYCCHCRECQAQSASAFGMSMRCASHAVEWSGEAAHFARDEGKPTSAEGLFCPHCGTRIMHRRSRLSGAMAEADDGDEHEASAGGVSIKAGSLDDTSWLRPVGHIWLRSAQPWFVPAAGLVLFDGQPDDWTPLVDAWTRALA